MEYCPGLTKSHDICLLENLLDIRSQLSRRQFTSATSSPWRLSPCSQSGLASMSISERLTPWAGLPSVASLRFDSTWMGWSRQFQTGSVYFSMYSISTHVPAVPVQGIRVLSRDHVDGIEDRSLNLRKADYWLTAFSSFGYIWIHPSGRARRRSSQDPWMLHSTMYVHLLVLGMHTPHERPLTKPRSHRCPISRHSQDVLCTIRQVPEGHCYGSVPVCIDASHLQLPHKKSDCRGRYRRPGQCA